MLGFCFLIARTPPPPPPDLFSSFKNVSPFFFIRPLSKTPTSHQMPVRAEMDEFDVAEEREKFGGGDDEAGRGRGRESDDGDGDDNGDDSDSDTSSSSEAAPPAGLAEFSRSIDAAIARLGGKALPKLDWSAPLDAAWLRPGGSLECSNADEVRRRRRRREERREEKFKKEKQKATHPLSFSLSPPSLSPSILQVLLLLKSSDRISHDLEELSRVAEAIAKEGDGEESTSSTANDDLLKNISAPTLALRRWHPLRPGAEFRAFLEAGCSLVALCQRDVTQHFEGLTQERRRVLGSVARFVRRELAPALLAAARPASTGDADVALPSSSSSSSVLASSRLVADLYVHASGKVRLVDLAVPGGTTSPLLFSGWEEVFPEGGRGGGEASGRGGGGGEEERGRGEEIENGGDDDDDASDAELSLPSSSSSSSSSSGDGEEGEEESEDESSERTEEQRRTARRVVRFRVVGGARGGIAPGRSLYGAPHDFADSECVEALVERLRATEG